MHRILVKNRNIIILSITAGLQGLSQTFLIWLLPLIVFSLGGPFLLALLSTFLFMLDAIIPLVSGLISSVIGRKLTLIGSGGFILSSLYLMSLAITHHNALLLLLSASLRHAALLSINVSENVVLMDSTPEYIFARVNSFITFIALVSTSIGSFLFGFLIEVTTVVYLLTLSLVIYIPTIFLYIFIKETRDVFKRNLCTQIKDVIKQGRGLFSSSPLFMGYIMTSAFISSWTAQYFWPYLDEALLLDEFHISIVFILCDIAEIIGTLASGYFVDKFGSVSAFILHNVVSSISLLVFASTGYPIAIVAIMVCVIFQPLYLTGSDKYLLYITDKTYRAIAISFILTLRSLSSIPGPIVGALLWSLSPRILYMITSLAVLVQTTLPLFMYIHARRAGVFSSRKPRDIGTLVRLET